MLPANLAMRCGEDYVIRLYHTDILTYRSDGSVELCHGGWETQATAFEPECRDRVLEAYENGNNYSV